MLPLCCCCCWYSAWLLPLLLLPLGKRGGRSVLPLEVPNGEGARGLLPGPSEKRSGPEPAAAAAPPRLELRLLPGVPSCTQMAAMTVIAGH
jgi:hypothetical protein